jgi:hypothetical protein
MAGTGQSKSTFMGGNVPFTMASGNGILQASFCRITGFVG